LEEKMKSHYEIYLEKFGKVKSGAKLEDLDYGEAGFEGFVDYDEKGKTAVALAAADVKESNAMRSKAELLKELTRLCDG
jgi:hypothetical protein